MLYWLTMRCVILLFISWAQFLYKLVMSQQIQVGGTGGVINFIHTQLCLIALDSNTII